MTDGTTNFFGFVTRGVLQGCPLSGLLFAWVIQPMLWAIEALIDRPRLAVSRACADDLGAVLADFRTLPLLELFETMATVSGLHLKPRKCQIVPLWTEFSTHVIGLLRDLLRQFSPAWCDFHIVKVANYLGFWLGPAANLDTQWSLTAQRR